MSERWKPNNGEKYFYVNIQYGGPRRDTWLNTDLDENRWENGDCFKTKEEAEYAAIKTKELLLSLHHGVATKLLAKAGLADAYCAMELSRAFVKRFANNNELQASIQDKPLPKLTEEVFDRPDCPEWAKYAVVNSKGTLIFFGNKPNFEGEDYGCWSCSGYMYKHIKGFVFDASDWQNSLIERPAAKLPDWCKVGQWAYYAVYKEYVKIKDIDEFDVELDRGAYCAVSHKVFREDYKLARLRPYNAAEIPDLPFEVTERNSNFRTTVVSCKDNKVWLAGESRAISTEELMRGFTAKGEPCGVLEHLENGEWVK